MRWAEHGFHEQIRKVAAIAAVLVFTSLNVSRANALYDTTTVGHHIKRVILYEYAVSGGHPQSKIHLRQQMVYLAKKYGFELDTIGTGGTASVSNAFNFTDSYLSGAQILIVAYGDGNVFTTDASQTAVINFVERDGHALFMINAASAFVPCPTNGTEYIDSSTCKFLARAAIKQYYNHNNAGTPATIYADSVLPGPVPGTGITSPYCSNQVIPLITTDHPHGIKNPETMNIYLSKDERGQVLPRSWTGLLDEWYTYRTNVQGYYNVRAQAAEVYGFGASHGIPLNGIVGDTEGTVNVLFTMDEDHVGTGTTSAPTCPVLGNHPQAWTRKMGNGLVAYNMMGHDENELGTGGVIYTQQDSALVRIDWRIMRYLARDFVGCMNPNYREYNPEATVTTLTATDDPNPGKTPIVTSIITDDHAIAGINASPRSIRITVNETGTYRIFVTDVKGKRVFAETVAGGLNKKADISGLRAGTYFVRVNAPQDAPIVKRISLY